LQAYILINTTAGALWKVAEALLKVKGVKKAHAVTGAYDVIAYVEFDTMETLGKIINNCHAIEGVTRTQTAIAIPEHTVE
jgi:DNA-binding Lrp family transcriptional regulator